MNESPESVADIQPGDVLAGKYRVERILGEGGMGTVVAAHHIQLDERVALKFLLPSAIGNMEAVARFMREARTAFKIKSEHVARVIDVGQLDNGLPYIVMEYLDGKDLDGWLASYGAMAITQAVDFVLQASEAIAEAHALGIVHRDLKPANLFCVPRADGQPCIKVLDFGISKLMNPTAQMHAMTRTNGLVGSPLYMSPEHMKSSKGVDARTDIWSLGVILYQLIAGKAPFDAEAVTELVLKVASEPPIPLRTIRPDAPPGLEAVLNRCLEKDREKRYQTIGEMVQALAEFGPPHARASVDRVVGTLEMRGAAKPLDELSMSGTNLAAAFPIQAPSHPHTLATWNEGPNPAKSNKRTVMGVTTAITLAAIAILSVLLYVNLKAAPPAAETTWSTPPPEPTVASPAAPTPSALPALPTPLPMPLPPAPASAPTQTAATREPEPAPPPTSASPAPATPPANAHPAVAAPAHRANCNPPYVISPNGTRRFKPECT